MSFGRTGGRGFEEPWAPYVFGVVVVVAAVLWVWFHIDLKRPTGEGRENDDGED